MTNTTSRFDGAVHDEANADIGSNRDGERVVRLDLMYSRGTAPSSTTMIVTLDAGVALRNQLDGLFDAAGVDDGDEVNETDAEATPPKLADQELLEAATATLRLWNKHGMGDDDAESEPVHQALVNAIAKAKGLL
ncbi:MAG: hypothetical protein LC135_04970 [Phycisphaerae bacterium]|nr:hypothetical protein [Phycisphaerae bacterium]MCZ2399205.1 hypothetical protein [Phycisphaerae bacterium]